MKKYQIKYCIPCILLLYNIYFSIEINAQIPTIGIVACYPFIGNANDMSGNGNHGTIYGATSTNDRFGRANNAYSFNGLTNYISIPFNSFNLQDFSYSVWAYATSYPALGGCGQIVSIGSYGGGSGIALPNSYSTFGAVGWTFSSVFFPGGPSGQQWWSVGTLPPLNTWFHLVGTRDGNYFKFYINGELVNSQPTNGSIPYYGTGPYNAHIGRRDQISLNQFFNGKIDDIHIYNRALTAEEVLALYGTGANSVTITANPGATICNNESVTFTAVINGNIVNPTYQWQVNGVNVGNNSPTYTTNTLNNGDVVRCLVIPSVPCEVPLLSNAITMEVYLTLTLSVSITASPGNHICSGDTVIFTAIPVNAGNNPSYQWRINGQNVGNNQASLSVDTLSDGARVLCILNSTRPCLINNTDTSNTIQMIVDQTRTQSISITADPGNSICKGDAVTFAAIPVNVGNNPVYQWKINGINVGQNQPTLYVDTLSDRANISCVLTSTASCLLNNPATSSNIRMTVGDNLPLSVSVTVTPGNIMCKGNSANIFIFTANGQNGGNNASYQWKINNKNVGTNNSFLIVDTLTENALIYCLYSSPLPCVSNNPAISNIISMMFLDSPYLDAGKSVQIYPSSGTYLSPTYSGGSPPYDFYWTPTESLSDPNISTPYATPEHTTTYSLLITDASGCSAKDTVTVFVADNEIEIFVPNTFSPNGDNINDVLYVRGLGIIEMDFFIFDRWGEKVFYSDSQETGWDGSYEGKMMNPGVFAYHLKVKTAENKIIEKKGNISLIR